MPISGLCVITICQRQSFQWRKVNVFIKGQANNTLPNYIHLGDTICLNCYNGILRNSVEFQLHAQTMEQVEINETDESMTDETVSTNHPSFF